jgi:hypothetical protein
VRGARPQRGTPGGAALLAVALITGAACAGRAPLTEAPPAPAEARGYRALFRGEWRDARDRGRFRLAVALLPPDRARLEFFAPVGGPRLVVAMDGQHAVALFPGERVYDAAAATPETLDRLLGLPLDPAQLVALITGRPMCRLEAARQQVQTRAAATFGRTIAWFEVSCPPGEIRYQALARERGGVLSAASIREGISGAMILDVEYDGYEEGLGPRWPRRIDLRLARRNATVTLHADEGPAASNLAPEMFAPPVPPGFERRLLGGSSSAPGLLGSTAERER